MRLMWSREQIIKELRRVASSLNKTGMSQREYQQLGKIGVARIKAVFGTWNSALLQSGLSIVKNYHFKNDDLFYEIKAVFGILGHIPSCAEWDEHASIYRSVIKKRFGGIRNAYVAAKEKFPELPDVEPKHINSTGIKCRGEKIGQHLHFPPFTRTPVNEHTTQALFAVMAESLQIKIIQFRPRFPDVWAERTRTTGIIEKIDIEIEYESLSYLKHHHPTNISIVLVCWKHNWDDIPHNIEVIELRSLINNSRIEKKNN